MQLQLLHFLLHREHLYFHPACHDHGEVSDASQGHHHHHHHQQQHQYQHLHRLRYKAIMTPLAPRQSHGTLWTAIALIWVGGTIVFFI